MDLRLVKSVLIAGSLLLALGSFAASKSIPGELIVKLSNEKQFMKDLKSYGVEFQRKINVSFADFIIVKSLGEKSLSQTIQDLNADSSVTYAEPHFVYEIVKPVEEFFLNNLIKNSKSFNYTPNDPRFGELWGLSNTGRNEPGGARGVLGADINALKSWEITKGSKDVTVAVIDTGVDYNHPDLKDQMWINDLELNGKDGIDDDGNGYVDDIYGYDFANNDGNPIDGHGHGTHCAGTIGAAHDNGIGVSGVMGKVKIMAIKFLSDSGGGSTEGAIRAIDYAIKMNVDIMSNSWGGGGRSQALEDVIKRASDAGIIFTAAAGNSSANNDLRPYYPASYKVDNVISVAALTSQNTLASFSSYGRETVHVAAPGHRVLSTVKNAGYKVSSGTSMSTPHVTGALGLLIAKEGRLPVAEVRERVVATSEPVAALRGKIVNGGRLDAFNLLNDERPSRNRLDPKMRKY